MTRAASERGVSRAWLLDFARRYGIALREVRNPHYKKAAPMVLIDTDALDIAFKTHSAEVTAAQLRSARSRGLVPTKSEIPSAQPHVAIRLRYSPPTRAVAYLGPTNSGKTYHALERLAEVGEGIYAAPLRMLAWEAYDRLAERLGEERVGLVTGEERINNTAPILCCTAEMAPMSAKLLVLDEVQWAADPDRGWAWTRLLAGAEVDELYITGEVGAVPLVRRALGDDVEVVWLERLVPLKVGTIVTLESISDRSCVVAFSRKAVLHLAGLLAKAGRSVSVLYGALPPEVRRRQIAQFISGETSIVVATDVIGHGINLPVDTVVFAETSKFDGNDRRPLAAWEIAQIGGRAGRYGLSDNGVVTTLSGVPGFSPDHRHIVDALAGHCIVEGRMAYRRVDQGFFGPSLDQLEVERPRGLIDALARWGDSAKELSRTVSWIAVSPVDPLVARLKLLHKAQLPATDTSKRRRVLTMLSLEDAWRLARSPLDADDPTDTSMLMHIGRVLVGHGTLSLPTGDSNDVEALETQARKLVALRWATLAFPGRLGLEHETVTQALDEVVDKLNRNLKRAVQGGVAHCESCGALCAPWFSECDTCHAKRISRRWYNDYSDWDDDDYDEWDDDDNFGEDDYLPPSRSRKQKRSPQSKARRVTVAQELDSYAKRNPAYARPREFPRAAWVEVIKHCEAKPQAERERILVAVKALHGAGALSKSDPSSYASRLLASVYKQASQQP